MKKKWFYQNFPKEPFSPRQAAKMLNVSSSYIYFELNAGNLKASRIGKTWKIMRNDLIKWIKEQNKNF